MSIKESSTDLDKNPLFSVLNSLHQLIDSKNHIIKLLEEKILYLEMQNRYLENKINQHESLECSQNTAPSEPQEHSRLR